MKTMSSVMPPGAAVPSFDKVEAEDMEASLVLREGVLQPQPAASASSTFVDAASTFIEVGAMLISRSKSMTRAAQLATAILCVAAAAVPVARARRLRICGAVCLLELLCGSRRAQR